VNKTGIKTYVLNNRWTVIYAISTIIILILIYEFVFLKASLTIEIVQALVLFTTNIIMILQFYEQRKVNKAVMSQNVTDYCDNLQKLIFEHPELFKIVNQQNELNGKINTSNLTKDENLIYIYLALHYANIEKVYDLYLKGDVTKSQWDSWLNFIKELSRIDTFKIMHKNAKGLYSADYWEYIDSIVNETSDIQNAPKIEVPQRQIK